MNKLSIIRILLLATLFLSIGCGSKKKALQKTIVKETIEVEAKEVEETLSDISLDKLEASGSSSTEVSDNTSVEVEADSTGVITRKVEKTDTGFVETITGATKVTFTHNKKKAEKKDTLVVKTDSSAVVETRKESESSIKVVKIEKDKELHVEVRSNSWWFWLLFLIGLLVIYRYRKPILENIKRFVPWI